MKHTIEIDIPDYDFCDSEDCKFHYNRDDGSLVRCILFNKFLTRKDDKREETFYLYKRCKECIEKFGVTE